MLVLATSVTGFLRDVFVEPIPIGGICRLLMLVPLTLMVSIVYKTIRCRRLSAVPLASLSLCLMIVTGMLLIGVFLLAAFRMLA